MKFRYLGNAEIANARRSARTATAARMPTGSSQQQSRSNSSFESVTSTRVLMINTTSPEAAKLSQWMSSWTHLTFEEYFAEQQAEHDDREILPEKTIDIGNTWEKVFLGETTIPGKIHIVG